MCINKTKLEEYRDLKISRHELSNYIPEGSVKSPIDKPIEVCNKHLISLLEKYKDGKANIQDILEWVNLIWFSGWFEYCDEECNSLASVMNELEEIDEPGKELNLRRVDEYIEALKNNMEI